MLPVNWKAIIMFHDSDIQNAVAIYSSNSKYVNQKQVEYFSALNNAYQEVQCLVTLIQFYFGTESITVYNTQNGELGNKITTLVLEDV